MKFSSLLVASVAAVYGLSPAMSQTDASSTLPDVVIGAPKHVAKPRPVARSTTSRQTSIGPANAASSASTPLRFTPPAHLASTTGDCSVSTWPTVSPVPCAHRYANSFGECMDRLMAPTTGIRNNEAAWWCTNQHFAN